MLITKRGECVKQTSIISKVLPEFKFDKSSFKPSILKKNLDVAAPKIAEMISNIRRLDEKDLKSNTKSASKSKSKTTTKSITKSEPLLFKHVIYIDAKGVLAKIVAAALIANGFNLAFDKSLKIDEEELLKKGNNNFGFLCGSTMYDKTFPVKFKKHINELFNRRPVIVDDDDGIEYEKPGNINGEYMRILLIDSAHREGIDAFDVKYLHILQDLPTNSERKQAIGRATRMCGQKGLHFNPTTGWPLEVFIYDESIPDRLKTPFNASTLQELYLKQSKVDIRLLTFAPELDTMIQETAVDRLLTQEVHSPHSHLNQYPNKNKKSDVDNSDLSGGAKNRKDRVKHNANNARKPGNPLLRPKPPITKKNLSEMNEYIKDRFMKYAWPTVEKLENKCGYAGHIENIEESPSKTIVNSDNNKESKNKESKNNVSNNKTSKNNTSSPISSNGADIVEFTPSQEFTRNYFQPSSAYKGLLLHHSTGSGKTCTSIAIATTGWEPHGYTIIYVTRTALKSDIYKNIFDQVCSQVIKRDIKKGLKLPKDAAKHPSKFLSDRWFLPISMKQFSNLCSGKNKHYHELVKRHGKEDPLKKTLIILDEAHKLYAHDIVGAERPDPIAVETALHNSYSISGKDSARILAMTATPYSDNPMDFMRIMNLMRLPNELLHTDFNEFAKEYLDEAGKFTDTGGNIMANQLAGYVSYLNREKDMQQFAYPIIHQVTVPMSEVPDIPDMDKLYGYLSEVTGNIDQLKQEVKDTKIKYREQLKEDQDRVCGKIPVKQRKSCKDNIQDRLSTMKDKRLSEIHKRLQDAYNEERAAKYDITIQKKNIETMKKNDVSQESILMSKCKVSTKT